MVKLLEKIQSPRIKKIQTECLEPYLPKAGKRLLLLNENLAPEYFFRETSSPHAATITLSPGRHYKKLSNTLFSYIHIQSHYEKLPLQGHHFNLIVVPYILEYCQKPAELIHEVYRCLAGEGKLVLFGFQHLHPWCWFNTPKPTFYFSVFSVKYLLAQAGFTINYLKHLHYGSLYVIEAQKHIKTLTPLKPQWAEPALQKMWGSLNEGKT